MKPPASEAHAAVAAEHARCRRGSSRAPRRGRCAPRARSTGRAPGAAPAPSRPTGLPSMRIAVVGLGRCARRRAPASARSGRCRRPRRCRGSRRPGPRSRSACRSMPCASSRRQVEMLAPRAGPGPARPPARARQRAQLGADHQLRHAARGLGLGVAGRHHLAAAQDRGAVAERFDLVQLVADVEDRAALGRELAQGLEQPARPPAASAPRSARP